MPVFTHPAKRITAGLAVTAVAISAWAQTQTFDLRCTSDGGTAFPITKLIEATPTYVYLEDPAPHSRAVAWTESEITVETAGFRNGEKWRESTIRIDRASLSFSLSEQRLSEQGWNSADTISGQCEAVSPATDDSVVTDQ